MFNIPLYLIHSEKLTWLPAIFPDKPIHSRELQEIVNMGKVKYVGLSEFSPEWTRTLHAIHPVTAVQIEWSLVTRCLDAAEMLGDSVKPNGVYAMEFWCLFFGCVFFLKQFIYFMNLMFFFCVFYWNTFFEQNNMNQMLYNPSMPEDGWSFHHQEHVCFTMNNGCCSMNKYAFAIWKSVLSASCFFSLQAQIVFYNQTILTY